MPACIPPSILLTSDSLCIRSWELTDIPQLVDAVHESYATVGRFLPWTTQNYSHRDAADWVTEAKRQHTTGDGFHCGVFLLSTGQLMGGIGINQTNPSRGLADLGYWIRQSQQHKGFATQAATLFASYIMRTCALSHLEIVTDADNLASRRVAEKCGATFREMTHNRLRGIHASRAAAV